MRFFCGGPLWPFGPGCGRWIALIFGSLAVVFVVLWAIFFYRFLSGGEYEMYHMWGAAPFMFFPGMIVMALVLVLVGLGLWWLMSSLFWNKYFPTQSPPSPPRRDERNEKTPFGYDDTAPLADKEELERRLDVLERALLDGRISEDTYRELKRKYEERLRDY